RGDGGPRVEARGRVAPEPPRRARALRARGAGTPEAERGPARRVHDPEGDAMTTESAPDALNITPHAAEILARFEAIDRLLQTRGFPATSPWWHRTIRRL